MRIEIEIRDEIPEYIALEAVKQVVQEGKISYGEKGKEHYSWATILE